MDDRYILTVYMDIHILVMYFIRIYCETRSIFEKIFRHITSFRTPTPFFHFLNGKFYFCSYISKCAYIAEFAEIAENPILENHVIHDARNVT